MKKRPAHGVDILKRLFAQAEAGDRVDAMELLGLHDELARIERKWLMQIAEHSERRKPADLDKLNAWYRRLTLLIEGALRQGGGDEPSAAVLRDLLAKCAARKRTDFPTA
jgi:hypothetical protein